MKPEEFIKHFNDLCEKARVKARAEGEQSHVVSVVINKERCLALLAMHELPSWLESHFRDSPQILYSSPASLR